MTPFIAQNRNTYMDLVKEVASKGPDSLRSIAIKEDQKYCNYLQLLSCAKGICSLLSNLDLKTVSWS